VLLLHEIADRPLLGHGLGATYVIAGSAVMGGPKGQQVSFHFVHDFYLAIAFRLGLPGLAIFLTLLWIYFSQTWRNLHSGSVSLQTLALPAGLAAAVFGQAVLSLTSPVFINHPTGGVIGSMIAMTLTKFQSASRDKADQAIDERLRA
jgi:O-antigen ligase